MLEGLEEIAESNDNAKIGALMLVKQFARSLGSDNCEKFVARTLR